MPPTNTNRTIPTVIHKITEKTYLSDITSHIDHFLLNESHAKVYVFRFFFFQLVKALVPERPSTIQNRLSRFLQGDRGVIKRLSDVDVSSCFAVYATHGSEFLQV